VQQQRKCAATNEQQRQPKLFSRQGIAKGLAECPRIITRSSAIAEGPRDALVSTNLAATKHPISKKLIAIDK